MAVSKKVRGDQTGAPAQSQDDLQRPQPRSVRLRSPFADGEMTATLTVALPTDHAKFIVADSIVTQF